MNDNSGDNVVRFPGVTMIDLSPDVILEHAKTHKFKTVLIIGITDEGNCEMFSSPIDVKELNWMLDVCKYEILAAGI